MELSWYCVEQWIVITHWYHRVLGILWIYTYFSLGECQQSLCMVSLPEKTLFKILWLASFTPGQHLCLMALVPVITTWTALASVSHILVSLPIMALCITRWQQHILLATLPFATIRVLLGTNEINNLPLFSNLSNIHQLDNTHNTQRESVLWLLFGVCLPDNYHDLHIFIIFTFGYESWMLQRELAFFLRLSRSFSRLGLVVLSLPVILASERHRVLLWMPPNVYGSTRQMVLRQQTHWLPFIRKLLVPSFRWIGYIHMPSPNKAMKQLPLTRQRPATPLFGVIVLLLLLSCLFTGLLDCQLFHRYLPPANHWYMHPASWARVILSSLPFKEHVPWFQREPFDGVCLWFVLVRRFHASTSILQSLPTPITHRHITLTHVRNNTSWGAFTHLLSFTVFLLVLLILDRTLPFDLSPFFSLL
jgi:hypothetical protein